MFHVYFGAFDLVAYAIAGMFAIVLASALCKEMDDQEQLKTVANQEVNTVQLAESVIEPLLVLDTPFFELHGTLVVKKGDLPVLLPEAIKVLFLRGDPVIRLTDLCHAYGRVAIDVTQVIHKWEQWSQHKRKKKSKTQSGKQIEAAVTLQGGSGHGTDPAFTV